MWIYNRAREILLYPKTAWEKIREENDIRLLIIYPIALAVLPSLAVYLGYGMIGLRMGPVGYYRMSAVNAFYSALVAYFLTLIGIAALAFLIQVIANYFQSECDLLKSSKLAVYAATAPLLANVFQIIPGIRILNMLGLYGAYLLYTGIPKLARTPADKEQALIFSVIMAGIIMAVLIDFLTGQYIFGIVYSEVLTY